MPMKKKGKKKSSSSKSSGRKSARTPLKSFNDPDADEESRPAPPTAREKLVDLLQRRDVKEREIFNIKVSEKVLENLSAQDIKDLKEIFEFLDVKKVGSLNITDLRRAFWILGFKPSREDVYEMMRDSVVKGQGQESSSQKEAADESKSDGGTSAATSPLLVGRCGLNQFIELVIDCQSSSRDRMAELQSAFSLFDLEKTGLVTLETLSLLNKKHRVGLTEDELREMLLLADFRGDGVIDVREFARVMSQTNIFAGVSEDEEEEEGGDVEDEDA